MELLYGEPGDASETQDIDAFPPIRRLCERVLLRPARLGEEPMRCKPLSSRCLPLSLGCSIMIASLGGLLGGEENVSLACSSTTESMERGAMLEAMVRFADGDWFRAGGKTEEPNDRSYLVGQADGPRNDRSKNTQERRMQAVGRGLTW
jgi:hypothetical protein